MHKLVTLPTMLALSIGLVACATQPNENLEEARSSFSALQSDARASKVAALELKTPATCWTRRTRPTWTMPTKRP